MLSIGELERIIRENQLPARILETGRSWVKVELTDPSTGLGRVDTTDLSSFMDLVLHWREHGCHQRPCPLVILREHHVA